MDLDLPHTLAKLQTCRSPSAMAIQRRRLSPNVPRRVANPANPRHPRRTQRFTAPSLDMITRVSVGAGRASVDRPNSVPIEDATRMCGEPAEGGRVAESFRVGITRDFLAADGSVAFGDIGLGLLDVAPGVAWEFLADLTPELSAEQIDGYDALVVLGPRVPAAAVAGATRLVVLARFGVGYDNVDVAACTRNGIAVTITPDGVRRPMATAILTLILALSGRLLQKDRLTRSGAWAQRLDYMGVGLTGRVLGSLGVGNIGRELFRLAAPLEMRHIAHDPYARPTAAPGVELVDLETLFRAADFVVVNCPLTVETRHLVNASRLALMKPTAFLIST